MTALLLGVVLAGALAQRISGLGFALIVSPLLVLVLGPRDGVELVNFLALLVSSSVLVATYQDIDWGRARLLVAGGLAGVLPGVLASMALPNGLLQLGFAVLMLGGLGAVIAKEALSIPHGWRPTVGFGVLSGFMTATTGTGGPALSLYALGTSWTPRAFAATVQLSFASQNLSSVALKGLPDLTAVQALMFAAAIAVGMFGGGKIAGSVSASSARKLVIAFAVSGSVVLFIKGVVSVATLATGR